MDITKSTSISSEQLGLSIAPPFTVNTTSEEDVDSSDLVCRNTTFTDNEAGEKGGSLYATTVRTSSFLFFFFFLRVFLVTCFLDARVVVWWSVL